MAENDTRDEFEKAAAERPPGLLREVWQLLKTNKKWWLAPIILALIAIGVLVIALATKAAPLIYPLL